MNTELRPPRGTGPLRVPGLCGTLSLPAWAGRASGTACVPQCQPRTYSPHPKQHLVNHSPVYKGGLCEALWASGPTRLKADG